MSIFPGKILLATDGSEDAELAATTVATLARVAASDVHVVNVGGPGTSAIGAFGCRTGPGRAGGKDDSRRAGQEDRKYGVRSGSKRHVRMGDAAKEVVNLAEEIGVSLVAAGRGRGRGGGERLWEASPTPSQGTLIAPCWWYATQGRGCRRS